MATIPPNPDWFVYSGPIFSRAEFPEVITGTAFASAAANPGWHFAPLLLQEPVAISNINVFVSLNASVPGATSQASTGSEGYSYKNGVSVFTRQDYGANSTNVFCIGTFSAGITATLGYSGTSQRFGMSWLTDASGGTSAFTTTSNAGNWSSYATGAKLLAIPMSSDIAGRGLTLSAGEYFVAHQFSSTTATSNSNVTLLSVSNLMINPQSAPAFGPLGGSSTFSTSRNVGIGQGYALSVTTNATMPASVIGVGPVTWFVQNFSNV